MINPDDKISEGIHFVSLFIAKNTALYFDFLEVNIFQKKFKIKSKINQSLTIYLKYQIMNLLCLDFIVSRSCNACVSENLC